ncbi:beta-lactamase family protein [Niabella sp. CC-SYL272]|uniref:serine hydrolase domain-containing protein n=1 Tax=Niabella agricola TaxID=2891571 RepID=UPI001F350DD4|nr:serine hydrolase domain-containing protein [Niabella agricola]MCF3107743.1 beta-lactamase family protein [Niabella agricola]
MRTYVFIIIFLVACAGIEKAVAQQSSPKIDAWLAAKAPDMGGRLYLLVYKDGNIIYSKGVNKMSDRQKRIENLLAKRRGNQLNGNDFTTGSKIPIASCSKWLSAALVMTFVDEGKLQLSDTVGKYLPVMTQSGKGHITISQCLSHLTGIKTQSLKEDLAAMRQLNSMEEAIARIATLPMEGAPGKTFHYSNAGLQIAGAVIEKISGKDFETLFTERIAGPLEMKNTDFGNKKTPLPAGGAFSTAGDYMHFLEMLLNKGLYKGNRILSEKSIAEMQANRISKEVSITYSPAGGGKLGYGFGEWVGSDGNYISSPGLFGSYPWIDNQKKYCAILFSYNINAKERHENYMNIRKLIEEEIL